MFLKFVQLKKAHFTSAATRFAYCFRNHFMFLKKYPKLSINKKWKAGKGANGSTIVNTKASLLQKTKAIQVNYSYRYNKFAVISYFQFIPFKNKILSLLLFSNGAASYINTTLNHKIFAYFFILKKKKNLGV